MVLHISIDDCQVHLWHPLLSNALYCQFNFYLRDGLIEVLDLLLFLDGIAATLVSLV